MRIPAPGGIFPGEPLLTGTRHHLSGVFQDHSHDPAASHARKRHAGALVRVNLPPLMGLRDAALAGAEKLLSLCGNDPGCDTLFEIAQPLAEMFHDAADACGKIIGMFNNPDTRARETRLLNFVTTLADISGALADCSVLSRRMTNAVTTDAAGDAEFDSAYLTRLNDRMDTIGKALFAQLGDAFVRYHERIVRYRSYAVKNLSRENAERYNLAYGNAAGKYRDVMKNICKNIQHIKIRSVSE